MNRIIKILMRRDGMTEEDARDTLSSTMEEVMLCIAEGDTQGAEDIFCSDLGLEPDYLFECIVWCSQFQWRVG